MLLEQQGQLGTSGAAGFAAADRDLAPFLMLAEAQATGIKGALVTISQINGGAPKPLGTQMAVLEDGRYLGHVSGGCVESAIAAEVAPLISGGKDQVLTFGKGSCYIDIRFPCGGGVDLLVHATPSPEMVTDAIARMRRREPFSLAFDLPHSTARIGDDIGATDWSGDIFVRTFRPRTRLLLIGRGPDMEVLARVAMAAEYDLALATPDDLTAMSLARLGVPIERLKTPGDPFPLPIDRWTATVLMFHEHEWEGAILSRAVAADGFYVGALGSVRTHNMRRERLLGMGVSPALIDRIRGPIGLVDRAKDPGTLALSVLAEVAAARMAVDAAAAT
jgi:xanthine dehydrogenase accessory factor